MMHNVAGKSLQRNSAHRAALRKNFTVSLIKHERVVTTLAKAKALRPFVEKMITLARSSDGKTKLHRIRRAISFLQDKAAVRKLFEVIGPRFANRQGGYTRILRMADYRIGDGGTKVVFELVENNVLEQKIKAKEAAATKDAEAAGV
ncbi:MAG: 50S ribosomal protein L17 [Planctomycetota bacterium]|jgi:large subunit ribosomal protein L17